MNNHLINADFQVSVNRLRRLLPTLSFGLLIGTYLVSAIIMGIFHMKHADTTGLKVAAFLIPLAIQAGRGTLVFFLQLNPARIESRYSMGVIAATILLILSLIEAWLAMGVLALSWKVSVSTLMLIGWVIEIMILKETLFATRLTLYQDRDRWLELHQFYIAQHDFKQFMKDLQAGNRPSLPCKGVEMVDEAQIPLDPGNVLSPSTNGQMTTSQ